MKKGAGGTEGGFWRFIISFAMRPMSSFDLILILVLLFGGIGLFLSSLKNFGSSDEGEAMD